MACVHCAGGGALGCCLGDAELQQVIANGKLEWFDGELRDNDPFSFAAVLWSRLEPRFLAGEHPASFAELSGRQKRVALYLHMFRLAHGVGEAGVRIQTPPCFRSYIKGLYPDTHEDQQRDLIFK